MLTEHERAVKRFMPKIKAAAAKVMLEEYGMKQQDVATLLDATQAAVSKYMKRIAVDGEFDKGMLRKFVASMLGGKTEDAKVLLCTMCQAKIRFDCAISSNRRDVHEA